MTRDEIIELVGRERYTAACAAARADSARPDYGRGADAPLDLPHEIEDPTWSGPEPWHEKLALFFSLYDDMPCYGHLMYARHHYSELGAADRADWWKEVRARLANQDAAVRQPLQYALWCDWFEDPETVEETWAALTGQDAPPAVLQAALRASGPVPYELKAELYERLLPDPAWHQAIAESLHWSTVDVYGQIDKVAARRVLARLEPSPRGLDREELRRRLE